MPPLKISNRDAKYLWLSVNGLAHAPTGPVDALAIIRNLGFVQLDTIQVVSRAHHHILWSRNQNYREPMLDTLLAKDRSVFEHFTHDASIIPMEFLPMWQRQFQRMKEKVSGSSWYGNAWDADLLDTIQRRIAQEGPLSTRDFDTKVTGSKEMWQRPPHKKALDFLWYSGTLATSHRTGFTKFYDLSTRIFPDDLRVQNIDDKAQVDWLCRAAIERIGFGTLGEIRKFWDATNNTDVTAWATRDAEDLVPVEIQSADGSWTKAIACADIETRLQALPAPTSRLRILNPFDPAIRDRTRLKRLFGFEYTVEMFVPAAKRKWGYYVYPILEGCNFVGRIEVKANRAQGTLTVLNLWAETGTTYTAQQVKKLDAELERLARFTGVGTIVWACPRP